MSVSTNSTKKGTSAEKMLRDYNRESYINPVKHEQTCCGYGIFASIASVLFLICAGSLLGIQQQRNRFNSTLQQTDCFIKTSSLQMNLILATVNLTTLEGQRVNTTFTKTFSSSEAAKNQFENFAINSTIKCFYKKEKITELDDLKDEKEVLIPSIVFFCLVIVPPLSVTAYYFLYWRKLVENEAKKTAAAVV